MTATLTSTQQLGFVLVLSLLLALLMKLLQDITLNYHK